MAVQKIVIRDPHGRVIASDEFENVETHNADADAHPALRAAIDRAGQVDDVKVNGVSVVTNKTASITVPVVTVEEEVLNL